MNNLPSNNHNPQPPTANSQTIPHFHAMSCASITQTSGSNFVKAFHCLPKEKTDAMIKIYAFCRIIDDCVDEPTTQQDKQTALNFWRNEVNNLYEHKAYHPVIVEIKEVINQYKIPKEYLMGLIQGCEMDITKSRYQTYEELKDYCYHVASLVGLICLKIFEYESIDAEKMAVELGLAFQLTNIMRDIQDDLKIGRIYLAQEDIDQCHYSEQDLQKGIQNQAFKDLMTLYYNRALEYYQSASQELKQDKDNKLVAAKLMSKTYKTILKKIKRNNFSVLTKRIKLNPIEKAIIATPLLWNKCKDSKQA